ncbi:MAG: hypothetical protein L6R42_003930 [Xanthoria sp. 1 TBL-2021]|nr:MAG: hypothetical protein L6R42_003930 [Xanthoria sp. 1 TBL-2021]
MTILAEHVNLLCNSCDIVYASVDEVVKRSGRDSPPTFGTDTSVWRCLTAQLEETNHTIREADLFIQSIGEERFDYIGQAQRWRILEKTQDQIPKITTKVRRHEENLNNTLNLINTLQTSSPSDASAVNSNVEATLLQCAHELIVECTALYRSNPAEEYLIESQGAKTSNNRVAEWVSTLESIRRAHRLSDSSNTVSKVPLSGSLGEEAHTVGTSMTSGQQSLPEHDVVSKEGDDSDDDLETDLAKVVFGTGTKAFEAQNWEEANSFFQEALQILQQLSKQKRGFCDIFDLQYKLAVCAYHLQEPSDAEQALRSLVHQSGRSDQQRGHICDAAHLLSCLYIRMGQIDRARSECEKALQGRRRLLGKGSDAALESTALLAHISGLLKSRARAQSYLAMIPEARRETILGVVEKSLGTTVEQPGLSSLLTGSIVGTPDMAAPRLQSGLSSSSLVLPTRDNRQRSYSTTSQSPATGLWLPNQRAPSSGLRPEDLQSVPVTSLASAEEKRKLGATDRKCASDDFSASSETFSPAARSLNEPPEVNKNFEGRLLSRKEILDKIGCHPKDRIEEAVCDGDYSAFIIILNKKKNVWRSRFRKKVRPERVTALHFAALFGEIAMAQRLLASSFNINEIPFGYSTNLTPLKFAIGARRVDMVDFLIMNSARPSGVESWSSLAGQLMNRSWLMKTMSETERECIPGQIIAILKILLKQGWNVNVPFDATGVTILHQAVAFWTGSYRWDMNLRASMTSFLCEWGADSYQASRDGKTPYAVALASGHQDLLLILDEHSRRKELGDGRAEPVELSSEPANLL